MSVLDQIRECDLSLSCKEQLLIWTWTEKSNTGWSQPAGRKLRTGTRLSSHPFTTRSPVFIIPACTIVQEPTFHVWTIYFLPQEVKMFVWMVYICCLQYLFQWKISYHVCPRRFFCKILNKIAYYPMLSGKEMFCWERFVFLGESETKQFTHCLCWLKIFIYWNYVIVNPEKDAEFLFSWSC